MAENAKKIVYILTVGPENPEKATLPFMLATAAQSVDVEAVVCLQGPAVYFAQKGFARSVQAVALPKLQDLMDIYVENGGAIRVCVPCMQARNITAADLAEGASTIAAVEVNEHCLSADAVLTY